MHVPLTITCLLLHALSLYGWGRAFERSIRLRTESPAVSVGLGLACVLALGGVSNWLGVAYVPTLWSITALGLGLAALMQWPRLYVPRAAALSPLSSSLSLLCALLLCALVVSTLVPPWTFNFHDDFQKYFAHPVRMLQTGSLRGSSASALGFETLGGQAFLHGFVLSWAGMDMLNAVDLGLSLPLCVALAGVGTATDALHVTARLLAVGAVVTLNPQIVNVSATYTASALCLAWLALGRSPKILAPAGLTSYACASGVLFAALCALKTTFVLLCAALYTLACVGLCIRVGSARALRWAAICAASASLALAPWLLLHAPTYLSVLDAPTPVMLATLATPYHASPWSLARDLYGADSFAMYSFAVGICGLIASYAWLRAPRRWRDGLLQRPFPAYLAVVDAACLCLVYLVMLYLVAPRSQGAVTIMRLFAPILIALLPGLLLIAAQLTQSNRRSERLAPLIMTLAVCVPFTPGLATRARQAVRSGSILAFPGLAEDADYIRYNQEVLYGDVARQVASAQRAVPPGAALIAVINTPFWLDFARNPIADVEPAGLATPWANIPRASYVIWEFNGYATIQLHGYALERDRPGLLQARIGDAGLRLTRVLIQLARSSALLYSDGHTLVMRLESQDTLRDAYAATRPTR